MKKRNIATFVQKKLATALPGQVHRSRPIDARTHHGGCWPQSDGRAKSTMWQSPGWPTPGKNIPRDAQRSFK